jgi:hypothetical protein
LKVRLPLFKKRSGSDRGSRDSAQPCRVAIGKILFAVLVRQVGLLDRREPWRVPAPVEQFINYISPSS